MCLPAYAPATGHAPGQALFQARRLFALPTSLRPAPTASASRCGFSSTSDSAAGQKTGSPDPLIELRVGLFQPVGLYGVMSLAAAQRTQEMGVRMAHGAGDRQLIALVMRKGFLQLAMGLGIGLAFDGRRGPKPDPPWRPFSLVCTRELTPFTA